MKMCWACNATEVESGLCLPCHSAGKHIPPGPKPEPTQLDKIEAMLAKLLDHMKDTTEYRLLHPEEFPVPEHGTAR